MGEKDVARHYGCPKGAPGASGISSSWNLTHAINDAVHRFGIRKDELLIGYRKKPPEDEHCKVYIYYNEAAVEYWVRRNGAWVNWSYQEQ